MTKLIIARSGIIIMLSMFIISSLACNMPLLRGSSQSPPYTVEPSEEALASFNSKWQEVARSTPTGPFNLTFTEAELTSAVAEAIAQTETDTGEDIPLSNVQVFLDDGVISAYALVQLEMLEINGLITIVPHIGDDGLIHVTITSAEFGPMELGPDTLAEVTTTIERSINQPIQASPVDVTLTALTIADGLLTVSGTINP
jgi:hypothetical protein